MRFREAYRAIELYEPGRLPIDIDLSDNTNLFGVAPSVREFLDALPAAVVTRYPSVFGRILKETLANLHDVGPDNIATGCGSDDLIDATVRAFCEPGDRVVYPTPTFGVVSTFARMNATVPVTVPTDSDFAFETSDLAAVQGAVAYVCSPNNPTGTVVPDVQIRSLDQALDGVVMIDEAYAAYGPADHAVFAAQSRRTVSLRTMSKAYGLAGMRVGYAIGPAEVIHEIEKARGPYKLNGLGEAAAVRAVTHDRQWVTDVIQQTRTNRARLADELTARRIPYYPSQANFLLLPLPAGMNAIDTNAALRTHGVAVRPFTKLANVGDALRVTVGPWEMMEKFLSALELVWRAE